MSSKKLSSPPAATIVGGNEDLLIETLIHLPPKALLRFKAVSKRWRSLISSPFFRRLHTLRHRPESQQPPSFILGSDGSSKFFLLNSTALTLSPFPLLLGFRSIKILQSCNGLLLLSCGRSINGRLRHYFVMNPTTAEQRSLSPLPSATISGLHLIFDPSLSPHYTVVCFARAPKSTLFHIYTSDAREWQLGGETTNKVFSFRGGGIYSNGGICFPRFHSSSSYRFVPDNSITKLPALPRHHGSVGRQKNYTMGSNGVLLCLTLSWKEGSNELHVSEMKDLEGGWRKRFRVDMRPVLSVDQRKCMESVGLLGMARAERDEDSLLLLRLDEEVLVYKFGDRGVFRVVECMSEEFQMQNRGWDLKFAHHFLQSFAPV